MWAPWVVGGSGGNNKNLFKSVEPQKIFHPVLSLFCQYQVHMHFRPQGAIYREIGFFCPLLKHTYWDASSAISAAKRRGLQKVYKPAQVSFFV